MTVSYKHGKPQNKELGCNSNIHMKAAFKVLTEDKNILNSTIHTGVGLIALSQKACKPKFWKLQVHRPLQ